MQHMVSLVQLGVGLEECARWWCVALRVQHTTSTHTPQDRHLATPRTTYAAFVKEIINSMLLKMGV